MAQIRTSFALGAAAAALVVGSATAATAAGTGIHSGSATGPLFSGNVKGSLLGTASVNTSLGGGSCNQSTMLGSVQSNGSALNISSASFTNNPGPACPGGGGTVAVTAMNLPWTGGNVTYDSAHTNGRDASVTLAGFKVKAVASILGGITCYYGGSVTGDGYNANNANRPDTSVAQAQIKLNNVTVNVQSGGSFLCPSTATVTAAYQLQGESSPGSGTYSLQLWVAAS